MMALNIGHLFNAGSSESEPETEAQTLSKYDRGLKSEIQKKSDELRNAAIEGIYLNHHLKNAKEAVRTGRAPNGLTPKVNVISLPQH